MLTGRTLRARRARSLGLVDAVTQERHVRAAVKDAVAGKLKTRGGGPLVTLFNSSPGRKLAPPHARAKPQRRRRENYPAPYALIDLWEQHGGDRRAMQKAEIASFARLLVTDTSQNLVRVFFLREKLKAYAAANGPASACTSSAPARWAPTSRRGARGTV